MAINIKEIKIRKFKAEDYWFCYRLDKRNMEAYVDRYWGGWKSKIWRQNLKPDNISLLEYRGRRIGFFDVCQRNKELYLKNIQISGNYQGKGLGAFLFVEIGRIASRRNLEFIGLDVFYDNPAINLYKKLGFKIVRKKDHSVSMRKKLN